MPASITHRQASILNDIGIDVWLPRDTVSLAEDAETGTPTPVIAAGSGHQQSDWLQLQHDIRNCQRCDLAATRTQTVFGVGNSAASLMLIGEAPGAEEDRKGEPFVGRAGKLLDAMLFSIGLKREDIFICNVLKCRPPNNRDPSPAEVEACSSWLDAQVKYVQPVLIVALGRFAAHRLLDTDAPVWRMRQADNVMPGTGIPLVVTYHPASLLRNPDNKARAWQDLCKIKALLS